MGRPETFFFLDLAFQKKKSRREGGPMPMYTDLSPVLKVEHDANFLKQL